MLLSAEPAPLPPIPPRPRRHCWPPPLFHTPALSTVPSPPSLARRGALVGRASSACQLRLARCQHTHLPCATLDTLSLCFCLCAHAGTVLRALPLARRSASAHWPRLGPPRLPFAAAPPEGAASAWWITRGGVPAPALLRSPSEAASPSAPPPPLSTRPRRPPRSFRRRCRVFAHSWVLPTSVLLLPLALCKPTCRSFATLATPLLLSSRNRAASFWTSPRSHRCALRALAQRHHLAPQSHAFHPALSARAAALCVPRGDWLRAFGGCVWLTSHGRGAACVCASSAIDEPLLAPPVLPPLARRLGGGDARCGRMSVAGRPALALSPCLSPRASWAPLRHAGHPVTVLERVRATSARLCCKLGRRRPTLACVLMQPPAQGARVLTAGDARSRDALGGGLPALPLASAGRAMMGAYM